MNGITVTVGAVIWLILFALVIRLRPIRRSRHFGIRIEYEERNEANGSQAGNKDGDKDGTKDG